MQSKFLAEAALQPQNKLLSPFAQTLQALPDLLRMMAGRLSLAGLNLLITFQY